MLTEVFVVRGLDTCSATELALAWDRDTLWAPKVQLVPLPRRKQENFGILSVGEHAALHPFVQGPAALVHLEVPVTHNDAQACLWLSCRHGVAVVSLLVPLQPDAATGCRAMHVDRHLATVAPPGSA